MKEVLLYKKTTQKKVQCHTCAHHCIIEPDKRGFCKIRKNEGGVLYVENYGKAVAYGIDAIEKKPLFHFFPGEKTFSFSASGCNFRCKSCQNFQISQDCGTGKGFFGEELAPEKIVNTTLENNLRIISYTYTEPTIFLEYALETMHLAKKRALKNVWVSNGFLSHETTKEIIPYLDGINIDIKSFSDDFYKENCEGRLLPVLETAQTLKEKGIWVEITTLVIPGLTDDRENLKLIANFISDKLGKETPWHLSRFSGYHSWKLSHLPQTSLNKIEEGLDIGKKEGLKYVYAGNVKDYHLTSTFCPCCGEPVIKRSGYDVLRCDKKGKCHNCGEDLNLIEK